MSYSGLGAPIANAINYGYGAAQYYSASAYMSVNTTLSAQVNGMAGAAATLNYKYGYQFTNYLTGYRGVQSYTPTIYYNLNVQLLPTLQKIYSAYDDASNFED